MEKEIKSKFEQIHLPFIKFKVDNTLSFNKGLDKRKEEIDLQTHKLISLCENFKLKYEKNKGIKKDNLFLKYKPKTTRMIQRQISNYIIRPKVKQRISILNNSKSKTKNNNNIKKINGYNYYTLRERYKKYNNNKGKDTDNIYLTSNPNSYSKKYLRYNNTHNDSTDNSNNYNYSSNKTENINKILSISDIDGNKVNSKNNLFLTNINNTSDNDDLKFRLKDKKEKFSKLDLLLKDTKEKSGDINMKLKYFNKNSRKNSPKSLKHLNDYINKKNKINFKEIFNKGENNIEYIKINLHKNKQLHRNCSLIKKSTADLIKYCQSLQLMPDDYVYKERKRIIEKYPSSQREMNVSFKSQENIKNSHHINYKYLIEKNCNKINILADDNITLFNNVLKKVKKL